jgi:1-acyl-sn-glycerol-3-phosphate acyltransferase
VATRKDRFIARLVSFLARAVFRDIEVHWAEPPSPTAPVLSVSNHFGGFADALVLLHAFDRRPGIVARDVIWNVPVVGSFMDWIGAIPVHKPEDGTSVGANEQMFGSCYQALRDGGHLLIFPEGVTRNEPSMARVKTGAARIALGAHASGAAGMVINPVGIHYEDKAALRSRVVVNGGRPIDVGTFVDSFDADDGVVVDADNRAAVDALTAEIDVRLRRAAPDYVDWREAHALTSAAEVTLRSQLDDRAPVPVGLRDRLANVLADRPDERRTEICEAMHTYQATLDGIGATDADIVSGHGGRPLLRALGQLLIGVLLAPFALAGALVNVVPFLIVKAVGLWRAAPSMLSTVKPIVAFAAFGITWGLVIWWAGRQFGLRAAAAAFVLMPVYLAAVIQFVERVVLAGRLVRRWRVRGRRGAIDDRVGSDRAAVVEAVLAA